MSPWYIALFVSFPLLLFFVVFAATGAGMIIGAFSYLFRAVWERDYGSLFGVITLGTVLALFGWVIMIGSYDAGSMIIDGIITRIRQ